MAGSRTECPLFWAGKCRLRPGSRGRPLACNDCLERDNFIELFNSPANNDLLPPTKKIWRCIGRTPEGKRIWEEVITHGSEEEPPGIDTLPPSGYTKPLFTQRPPCLSPNTVTSLTEGSSKKY